jgi:hypothetical protein
MPEHDDTECALCGAELPPVGATCNRRGEWFCCRSHRDYSNRLLREWIDSRDQLACEIRRRREQDGVGYLQLAKETGLPLSTIRDYCTYRSREKHDA